MCLLFFIVISIGIRTREGRHRKAKQFGELFCRWMVRSRVPRRHKSITIPFWLMSKLHYIDCSSLSPKTLRIFREPHDSIWVGKQLVCHGTRRIPVIYWCVIENTKNRPLCSQKNKALGSLTDDILKYMRSSGTGVDNEYVRVAKNSIRTLSSIALA